MKFDNIQGTLRFITPGLYLLILLLFIFWGDLQKSQEIIDFISKNNTLLVIVVPFVGFVLGYLIEGIMVWLERGAYKLGISSPERKVLNGTTKYYHLKDDLRETVLNTDPEKYSVFKTGWNTKKNEVAYLYMQEAKQTIGDNSVAERYLNHSIMARHILGAQIIASICFLVRAALLNEWSWLLFSVGLFLFLVTLFYYYHLSCDYMDYLFAEYGKELQKK